MTVHSLERGGRAGGSEQLVSGGDGCLRHPVRPVPRSQGVGTHDEMCEAPQRATRRTEVADVTHISTPSTSTPGRT
jgi:hypothetical protein